jgi:hypothetical protein
MTTPALALQSHKQVLERSQILAQHMGDKPNLYSRILRIELAGWHDRAVERLFADRPLPGD